MASMTLGNPKVWSKFMAFMILESYIQNFFAHFQFQREGHTDITKSTKINYNIPKLS